MNDAYSPENLAADIEQVIEVLCNFFAKMTPADWDNPTENRATGWTLRQVIAHLTAIAEILDQALDAAIAQTDFGRSGFRSSKDLFMFNSKDIEDRQHIDPPVLIDTFLNILRKTIVRTRSMTPQQFALKVNLLAYNRPMSLSELIGVHIVHPAIVHGAQLANGIRAKPLWTQFSPDLMNRQITRFFNVLSHAYLVQSGYNATVNFRISGSGEWHLILRPDGGESGTGSASPANLTLWARSSNTFLNLSTFQIGIPRAILTGQAMAWGNIGLAMKFQNLFVH